MNSNLPLSLRTKILGSAAITIAAAALLSYNRDLKEKTAPVFLTLIIL